MMLDSIFYCKSTSYVSIEIRFPDQDLETVLILSYGLFNGPEMIFHRF